MRKPLLAAVVAALLLAGCGWTPIPGDASQLAIRKIAGGFEFQFEPCSGYKLTYLRLSELEDTQRSWNVEAPDRPGQDVRTVRFFQAPAGWVTSDEDVSSIRPGQTYYGSALSGPAGASSMLPRFTLEQIDALKEGEVLGRISAAGSEAMSYEEFKENAAEICEPGASVGASV